ncbi:replication initiation protein [uncultured Shewanella sp.]|uniref:replication initiation protein n=1 Tax=uncultured Shewanella sp. TaxID=173975 RepID=UPI00263057C4|nr:replication initiation protein [uncultured Shewanella sp.]
MNNSNITKSNSLIAASYMLSLQEQRLILACLSKIDSREETPDSIELTVQEFSTLMGVNLKRAYNELYDAAEKLYDQSITIENEDRVIKFRWVQHQVLWRKGEGKITLTWSKEVKGYISQLKNRFTTYKLRHIANLQSIYSMRLYEILMQFDSTKHRLIKVEELRKTFLLNDKYPEFKDLNKYVIKNAVNELNQRSDLIVSYDIIKQGRKASALRFDFKQDKNMKLKM